MYGKTSSIEILAKLSKIQKDKVVYSKTKAKINTTKGTTIYIYSVEGKLENNFSSVRKAGKYFNCCHNRILRFINIDRLFKNQWLLSSSKEIT